MKILMLTTDLSVSGVSTTVIGIACRLSKLGMDVVCASGGGEMAYILGREGIAHYVLPIRTKNGLHPKILFSALKLVEVIRRERVELVHAHTHVAQIAAQVACLLTRIPFVTTDHTFHRHRGLRRLFPFWGEHVIAVSEPIRESLVNDLRVSKSRVTCIPDGVDTEHFQPLTEADRKDMREFYKLPREDLVIGSVSRLVETKGYQYLFEALPGVLSRYPKISLLLVGDGKYRAQLTRQIEAMGLNSHVRFVGFETDIRLIMGLIDIFVLPSTGGEGLGLPVLEAMAGGRPIVASNVGGLYTLVKDEVNGFLVPPGDAASLEEALCKLLGDHSLRERMGRTGRRMAHGQFSLDVVTQKYRDTYEKVLANHVG